MFVPAFFNASLSEYDVVINEATERFKMRIKTNEGMLVIYNVFEQGTPEEKVKAIECLRDSDTLTVAPGEPMAVRFMLLGMRDKSPEVRGFAAESLASFISMKPHQNAYRGDYEFYLERGKVLQRDIVQSASFGERSIFMVRKNSPYDVLPTIAEAIRAEKDPEVKAKMQEALSSIRDSAKTYSRRRFAFEYKMLEIGVRIDIWNLEEKKIDEMQEFSETSEFEEMKRKHGDGFDEYVLERFKVKDSKEFKELDKDKNLFKDDFSESLVKLVKKYSIEGNWDHLRYKENGERLLSEQNVKRVEERIKK
ncbi:MAG: hypothetical protein NT157_01765 [Candidatus Micrarchaeota archaeon]|nr:hypothetical protein [Candidatus Micrarchaeota archaeon]